MPKIRSESLGNSLGNDTEMFLRQLIELQVATDAMGVLDDFEQPGNAKRRVVDQGPHVSICMFVGTIETASSQDDDSTQVQR